MRSWLFNCIEPDEGADNAYARCDNEFDGGHDGFQAKVRIDSLEVWKAVGPDGADRETLLYQSIVATHQASPPCCGPPHTAGRASLVNFFSGKGLLGGAGEAAGIGGLNIYDEESCVAHGFDFLCHHQVSQLVAGNEFPGSAFYQQLLTAHEIGHVIGGREQSAGHGVCWLFGEQCGTNLMGSLGFSGTSKYRFTAEDAVDVMGPLMRERLQEGRRAQRPHRVRRTPGKRVGVSPVCCPCAGESRRASAERQPMRAHREHSDASVIALAADEGEVEVEETPPRRFATLRGLLIAPWTLTDPAKCAILVAVVVPATLAYVATQILFLRRPEIAPYVDPRGLHHLLLLHATILAAWVGVGIAALWYRKRRRVSGLIHVAIQLYAVGFTLVAWWIGAFSDLYFPAILFGGASVGFLFAEVRQMLGGFASSMTILFVATVAEQLGWLPYAPLFAQAPFAAHHLATSWLLGYVVIDLFLLYMLAALVGVVSYRLRGRERLLTRTSEELARATDLISRYVAAQVAEQIRAGNWHLIEGTSRRKVTIFFSDIQNFTATAESLEPEDLATLLNEYLSDMTAVAEKHGGTIDKFVGDAIMIFFGAPLATDDRDHALRAVRMAVDMQHAISELGPRWAARGLDYELWVRMGINTGVASVGNFGSKGRVDYTAIGRQVNLAARLQASCEPGRVLLSHATWLLVRDEFDCTPRGEIVLKGIRDPVRTYEVVRRAD